jgi:hypothetical protein
MNVLRMSESEGSGGSPSLQSLVVLNEGRRSWRGMLREAQPYLRYSINAINGQRLHNLSK